MSAGSARPLEDAFRIAQHDMVTWVAALCGLDPLDAYQFVTQAVESPLANVCDTNYTSIAKMPKRYLPKPRLRRDPRPARELAASLFRRKTCWPVGAQSRTGDHSVEVVALNSPERTHGT